MFSGDDKYKYYVDQFKKEANLILMKVKEKEHMLVRLVVKQQPKKLRYL